jgi:hypothetical protein
MVTAAKIMFLCAAAYISVFYVIYHVVSEGVVHVSFNSFNRGTIIYQ